jgi:hypothetical protein
LFINILLSVIGLFVAIFSNFQTESEQYGSGVLLKERQQQYQQKYVNKIIVMRKEKK